MCWRPHLSCVSAPIIIGTSVKGRGLRGHRGTKTVLCGCTLGCAWCGHTLQVSGCRHAGKWRMLLHMHPCHRTPHPMMRAM